MLTYTAPPGTHGSWEQAYREAQALVTFLADQANHAAHLREFPNAIMGTAQCANPLGSSVLLTATLTDAGGLELTSVEQPVATMEA